MKKLLAVVMVSFFFSFLGVSQAKALTTELISETETEKVYYILATPPQDSSAIQLKFSVSGGSISNVESLDSNSLRYIPTCDNGTFYEGQNVCADIATVTGFFTEDQAVLAVTVVNEPGTEVLFNPGEDYAYLSVNGELVKEGGEVLQVFPTQVQIEEPAPVIEEAKTNDTNYLPFVLLLGILVVLVGAFLAIIFFSDKDSQR